MTMGQAMACWQIKGLLLLVSALVATGLAASTAGAGSPSPDIAALARPRPAATAAPPPEVAPRIAPGIARASSRWYGGDIEP